MHLFLTLALASSSPALADVTPRCGFGGGGSVRPEQRYGDCDTGDTATDCEDTGIEAQAHSSDSSGLPAPVVGSLMASVLIVGFGAMRRSDEEN